MVTKVQIEDVESLNKLQDDLWFALGFIRGSMSLENYYIILFLFSLQKEGYFEKIHTNDHGQIKDQIKNSIKSFAGEKAKAYNEIFEVIEPELNKISSGLLAELIKLFYSLNQDYLKKHYPEIFDGLIYRFTSSQGKFGGEFIQPKEISQFICNVAALPASAKIYNPFAGLASFAIFFNEGQTYTGQEINTTTWAIGYLRILAHQRKGVTVFIKDDSVYNWNPAVNMVTVNQEKVSKTKDNKLIEREKFDLIVANPPLGNRVKGEFGQLQSGEHFIIEKGIKYLTPDGKLIVVISLGFLFHSGAEQKLRQFLVHQDLLESIILLPGGILRNTSISVAILVINKKKKEKGVVRFVDAKKCITKISSKEKILNSDLLMQVLRNKEDNDAIRIVSNEEIGRNNYNLLVLRYFKKSFEGVELLALLSPIRRQTSPRNEKGKFIQNKDLKTDKYNYALNLSLVEEVNIISLAQLITESCLLIDSVGGKLKATYFKYVGVPIYIHPNLFSFKVDEDLVDLDYLINELNADSTKEQLAALVTGAVIPRLKKEDFLSIKIELPSKAEQKAKIKGVLESLAKEKKQELTTFNKIHGLENAILEQNAYLRHSLAGASTNLKGAFKSIKKIIEDQIEPLVPGMMNFKETPSHVLEFKKLLEILQVNVDKITQTTSRVTNTSNPVEGIELYPVEIFDYLENYCKQKKGIGNLPYSLVFEYDAGAFVDENAEIINTYILANKDLLTDLLDNIIQNAQQHAFPGYSNNRIEIYLMINSDDKINTDITILVSNTGKPFPEDFSLSDFIRNGSTTGDNGGDGYGGWLINQIVKYFNGKLDIVEEEFVEGFPAIPVITSVEITIPITQFEANENV